MSATSDPIGRDVFQHQAHSIAEEMSMALRRAAFSSIIWDMYDYSCGLFTPAGDMIDQAETIPAQLGIMSTAIRYMFRRIPLDQWRPGDIIVCNDPYRGCTHTMDICLFSPVFNDGELIAITSTIAHHIDIGGKVPGTEAADNIEVFAEGLILPPLKLVEEGAPNEAIFDIVAANVRDPAACQGDLRAQIAGCRTGERRIAELAGQYGNERFARLVGDCIDYAETYMRRSIEALPDGVWEGQVLIEDDVTTDEPIRLHARVTIAGDALEVDLSGSSDQRANGLNCPEASTSSMVNYAVKCIVAPDLVQNQGWIRPISIKTRRGSILDPHRPAAVSVRHLTQQALADAVLRAMAPIDPTAAAAGCQISFPTFVAGGLDDRPERCAGNGGAPYYIVSDIIGGGMGGSARTDGLSAVDTHGGNCAILSAEVLETIAPFRVRRTALVEGSGGAGRHRGGLGILREYELLSGESIVSGYVQQTRDDTAPWGFDGGGPGGKASLVLNPGSNREEVLPSKLVGRIFRRGDVFRIIGAGGGGWGDPADRDTDLVTRDRREGYVPS
jgi:N-methylhydantoinase B